MVKVVVNNGQYKVTIPRELALSKSWNSSTVLRFVEDTEGNIYLKELITAREQNKKVRA